MKKHAGRTTIKGTSRRGPLKYNGIQKSRIKSSKRYFLCFISQFIVLLIGQITNSSQHETSRQSANNPINAYLANPHNLTLPKSVSTPVGVTAIPVVNHLLTKNDIIKYTNSHGIVLNYKPSDTFQLLECVLINNMQLEKTLNIVSGFSSLSSFWLIEVKGSFAILEPSPLPSKVFPYAFEVFDASSGNLLLSGGLNSPLSYLERSDK